MPHHSHHQETLTPFQRKLSSRYFPLLTVVEPSTRLSHSDVMCVSNSGMKCQGHERGTGMSKSNRSKDDRQSSMSTACKLPYEELYSSSSLSSSPLSTSSPSPFARSSRRGNGIYDAYNKSRNKHHNQNQHKHHNNNNHQRPPHETPLQQKQSEERRQKLNRKLHAEHRVFMTNLQRERRDRLSIETNATLIIQRYMRGFHIRRNQAIIQSKTMHGDGGGDGDNELALSTTHMNTRVYTEREIWQKLLMVMEQLGVKPTKKMLLGFDLPEEFQGFMKKDDEDDEDDEDEEDDEDDEEDEEDEDDEDEEDSSSYDS